MTCTRTVAPFCHRSFYGICRCPWGLAEEFLGASKEGLALPPFPPRNTWNLCRLVFHI